MSSLTAGWILSGASSQWKNAKPGKVFDALVNGSYANPVIAVDEIDKAGSDAQYDPLGALYALLEHDTARAFIDEFAEVPIDAGNVIWIATANEAHAIPEPLLNRMNVYEIEPPDAAGARRIAQTIYDEIRTSWGGASRTPSATTRSTCWPRPAAHDAPRAAARVRRRTARRARRDRAARHPGRRRRREAPADRLLIERRAHATAGAAPRSAASRAVRRASCTAASRDAARPSASG